MATRSGQRRSSDLSSRGWRCACKQKISEGKKSNEINGGQMAKQAENDGADEQKDKKCGFENVE